MTDTTTTTTTLTLRQRIDLGDQAVSRLWASEALILIVNDDKPVPEGAVMIGCGCDEPEYGQVDVWSRWFVPAKANPADVKIAASSVEYFIKRTVGSSANIREDAVKALEPFFV
jgi:hypothetical protein